MYFFRSWKCKVILPSKQQQKCLRFSPHRGIRFKHFMQRNAAEIILCGSGSSPCAGFYCASEPGDRREGTLLFLSFLLPGDLSSTSLSSSCVLNNSAGAAFQAHQLSFLIPFIHSDKCRMHGHPRWTSTSPDVQQQSSILYSKLSTAL